MSASNQCDCRCPTPEVVDVPGTEGEAGANGTDGINAYTLITGAGFTVPAVTVTATNIPVANTSWMVLGEPVFIEGAGTFQISQINSSTSFDAVYLSYPSNTHEGDVIAAGAGVTPSGFQTPAAGALPTAFTDNSGGTASDTIAARVGVSTMEFFISAAAIANGDLLTNYVPGYKFKILKFDARCADPVTTAAKASTLNLEINSTDVTGGVISLSGLYAQGAAQAGTAITAANTGNASASISIEASATTTFIEGGFWLIISIQNQDTADAFASLAEHIDELIAALS